MKELIIIWTENSERVHSILNKEHISYEIFREGKNQEDKLLQEYQESWKNPQRIAEAQQWKQATMNDWVERVKN